MGLYRKKPVVVEARQLTGEMKAELGDWIMKGIAGEFYPCKPDIFAATYEAEGGFAETVHVDSPLTDISLGRS